MPIYENDVDLTKEYATSIEIRGPPEAAVLGALTEGTATTLVSEPSVVAGDTAVFAPEFAPDLAGLDCYAPSQIAWGETFTLQGQVRNYGTVTATATFTQTFYLSNDTIWGDPDDVYLGSYSHSADVPALGGNGPDFYVSLTLPSTAPSGYAGVGTFYIGMMTDAYDTIEETDETNNGPGDFSQGWDWDSFTIVPTYDLIGLDCYAPSQIAWGETFTLQGQVHNYGNSAATPTFVQYFYLSIDQIWGEGDVYLGSYTHSADVPAWGNGPDFNVSLTLPSTAPSGYAGAGTFYIGMQTDATSTISETDETNNGPGDYGQTWDWDSFTIVPTYDLIGLDCYAPDQIAWGETFTLQGQVRNLGNSAATPTFWQIFYLSNNTTWGDGDDLYLGSYTHSADVPAWGFGPDFYQSLTLPSTTPSGYAGAGPFYIGMLTDAYDNISETDETNNGPGDYGQTWDWDSFTIVQEFDFGDAPDSYQTLLGSDGARHRYNPDYFLGGWVDTEANGQPSPPGLGDDYNGDDEDGVSFTSALVPGSWTSVQVVASADGFLDAWIDFNADGSFWEPEDRIFDAQWLNSGTNNPNFWVPDTATGGMTYARFRFSEGGGLDFFGEADSGEVEDYTVNITAVPEVTLSATPSSLAENAAGTFDFTFSRSGSTGSALTINFSVSGAAVFSDDYTQTGAASFGSSSGTVIIPTGSTTATVSIDPRSDTMVELDETVILTVTPGSTYSVGSPSTATATIANDDIALLGISDGTCTEGNSGSTTGCPFTVTLSASVDTGLSVDYTTADYTATLGDEDYQYASGTLNFNGNAGETQTLTVYVYGDDKVELNETFLVNLGGLWADERNVSFADPQGLGTIMNDDGAALSISDVAHAEGDSGTTNFTFTVSLTPANPTAVVTVNYATANGTAQAGSDYLATSGTLLFDQSETEKPVTVAVYGDTDLEADETFFVNLSNPTNASISDSQGIGIIQSDDVVQLDFGDAPDPYPTRMDQNGARHSYDPDTYLGFGVDLEPDGQPDGAAQGDDNNGDDEDGVTFASSLVPGASYTITVRASRDDGYLNAWIDFNGVNGWSDPGEQIFTDQPLSSGDNTLSFHVPVEAVPGAPCARFRFSMQGGLSYEGLAEGGEVEDYRVEINEPLPGIDIEKCTNGQDADDPPGPTIAVGDPVTWTYEVTNTGNVPLINVAVTDDHGVMVTYPQNTLDVGESMTCTASGVAVAGQYANIGMATADAPDGTTVGDEDPSHYVGELSPMDFGDAPVTGLVVPAGVPQGGDGYLGIREVIDNGAIGDQTACYASLSSGGGTIVDYTAPVLNIQDNSERGLFLDDSTFGVVTAGHRTEGTVDDLSMVVQGAVHIPTASEYTFCVNSDDGFTFQFPGHNFTAIYGSLGEIVPFSNGHALRFSGGRPSVDTLGVIFLPAGDHPFILTYHESISWASVELSATSGVKTAVDSDFRLVGHQSLGTVYVPGFMNDVDMTVTQPGAWSGGQIVSLENALDALSEGEFNETNTSQLYPQVNHSDPDSASSGVWPDDTSFPNGVGGMDDDDFAVRITGQLDIPVTGTYQFGFNSDDGALLRISRQRWSGIVADATGDAQINGDMLVNDSLTARTFTAGEIILTAGQYAFEAVMYENIGGSFFELFGRGPSSGGGLDPTWHLLEAGGAGSFTDIDGLQLVAGSAPYPPQYPTLLVQDGAYHLITETGPFLGTRPDPEPDGQPDANALGDDLDTLYPSAGDDEDGVTIPTLVQGMPAEITVEVGGSGGEVTGWIDWNGVDGWEPTERVYAGTLSAGTHSIPINVPVGAIGGATYARFRISSQSGLEPSGPAADGEVEDYEVQIVSLPENTKWVQLPDLTPNGIDIRVDEGCIVADDFECTQTSLLTDVHLWGSWKNDREGQIQNIHLSIHRDDPAGEGGTSPDNGFSQPEPEEIWSKDFGPDQFFMYPLYTVAEPGEYWWDPTTGELIAGGDQTVWQIDIPIDPEEAFLQQGTPEEPVIYWLDVSMVTEGEEVGFGWKTRQWPDHFMDDAVWDAGGAWNELRYPESHPYYGLENDSVDMAFALTFEEEVILGSIHAFGFEDLDGDGILDPEDTPWNRPGVPLKKIDLFDGDGNFITSQGTDANGRVSFENLLPGVYTLQEDLSVFPGGGTGAIRPAPDPDDGGPILGGSALRTLTITNGQELVYEEGAAAGTLGEGQYEVLIDDATTGTPGNGINEQLVFGNFVLGSIHGFKYEDVGADGGYDPSIDVPLGGVTFTLTGTDGQGNVIHQTTTTDEAGEFGFTDLLASVAGHGPGTGYTVTETVPANYVATTATSFSTNLLSRQELVAFAGQAELGPEDPRVEVVFGPELMFGNCRLDFGDAPDQYPIVLSQNGARHIIVSGGPYLGSMPDYEPDGQPDANALGDDTDFYYPPANDDEDGVVFPYHLIQGQTAVVQVTPSVTGTLNAWLDFNADGNWSDPDEQIFADVTVNPGDPPLEFHVPGGALVGTTFARFRISSQSGLSFDGLAADGEVEDYAVQIDEPAPAIDIEKSTNGYDADTAPGPSISPGDPVAWTYTVTNTGNVTLTNVTVSDDQGVAVSCPQTSLQPGESMTCTASGTAVAGPYVNTGTAEGDAPDGTRVTDSDPSHYLGQVPLPDLTVTAFNAPGSAYTTEQVGSALSVTIRNEGSVDVTGQTFTVGVYLSPDPKIEPWDRKLTGDSTEVYSLAAGQSLTVPLAADLSIPADTLPGTYYIGALVDEGDVILETFESNNSRSQTISILQNLWTIMVFLNGDDDTSWPSLETSAVTDLNEMEAPNFPPSVNVVVQFDRIPGYSSDNIPASDTAGGNWTDTRRAVIEHDTNTSDVGTPFVPVVPAPGSSELNMGTTQTLVDFVTWATTHYPADKYALILWDHGDGWRDCSNDFTDSDKITMTELRNALDQIGAVDLLGFDMCLMGMAEVATEVVGHADYVVFSEEIEPLEGWAYDKFLPLLVQTPNASAEALAKEIVATYYGPTLSAVDMSAVPLLNADLDAFAIECQNVATSSDWGHIQAARNSALYFTRSEYRDLRQFMTTISGDSSITQAIRTRASTVVTQLDTAVVANHTDTNYCHGFGYCKDYTGAGGLSIYLPDQGSGTDPDYNATNLTFCDSMAFEGTDWRDFLLKLPGGAGISSSKFTDDWGQNIGEARVLETSAGVRTIVDSAIDSVEDVDFFRIAAAGGQLLYVTAYGDGLIPGEEPGLVPILTMYASDGETVLAQAQGNSDGQVSVLSLPLPYPADYYLAVTSLGNGDPLNPVPGETEGRYTLDLIYGAAEDVNPGLSVSEDVVDFGEVEVASSSWGSVVLTNTGATSLEITACSLSEGSPFFVSGRFAVPIAMGPFESMGLFVGVRPGGIGPVSDILHIYSTDPDQEYFEVELRAVGVDYWGSDDIGVPAAPGSDSLDRGVWTLGGVGVGVGGTADEGHYVHQPWTGPVDLVARIVDVEATEPGSEVGVMIRDSLEPDSPQAAVLVAADGRVNFRRRPIAGEDTDETIVDAGDLPIWVRIVRRRVEAGDDEVEGYVSIDGETWQLIGTDAISLSDAVHTGIVATSGSNSHPATVSVDRLKLAGLPDLYLSYFDAPALVAPGEDITDELDAAFSNIGSADAGPSRVGVYLSNDATITSADTLLVGAGHSIPGIPAMSSLLMDFPPLGAAISIPGTFPLGSYYLGILMDDQGVIIEGDENNNYESMPVSVVNKPDLYVSSVTAAFTSANLGEAVGSQLSVQVGNQGQASAPALSVGVYLSSDVYITTADYLLVNGQTTIGPLAAGATTSVSVDPQARIPTNIPPGTYYIAALADNLSAIDEVDETNNSMYQPTQVTIVGPDLIVDSFHCERGAAGPGQTLEDMLTLWVRNQGPIGAVACSVGIYLSTDQVITAADTSLIAAPISISPLAGNSASTMAVVPASVSIPSGLASGDYYIGALVDTADTVAENNENNNYSAQPIAITNDTWTIMGYFAGDCDREWQAATNLDQLELVNTAGTGINLSVLLDRNPKTGSGYWDAKIPSTGTDWSDTRWGTVTYDGKAWDGTTVSFATTLQLLDPSHPEKNTGDPTTFTDYITKAMTLAPAQHYAIWFYDHGSMGGFGRDDTSGKDGLDLAELHAAFDQIPFVDVVLFDACLMQDIEVVTELIGDVGYVMASQSERWGKSLGSNIYVDKALNWLTQNQNASAKQLAQQLMQYDMHAAGGGDASVVDMALVDNLNDAMNNFTTVALNTASAAEWVRLRAATNGVEVFSPWNTYLDLWGYLDNVIKDTQISATIRSNAAVAHDLLDPIQKKVIVAQNGKGSGLSTYLPPTSQLHPGYNGATYTYCDLLDKDGTHWREFLLKLDTSPSQTQWNANFLDLDADMLGDSFDGAEPVGIREVPASMDSNINEEWDVDMVKVTAQAGDVLYANLYGDPANGGLMPVLTVYGPDRDTVLAQATGNQEGCATLPEPIPLPQDGEYYLAVTSVGNTDPLNPVAGETLGRYTLSLTWGAPEIVVPDLEVAETVVDLGEVEVGSWSSQTIRLTNQGGIDLQITELVVEPEDSPFLAPFEAAVLLPIHVAPGGTFDLSVGVNPQAPGPITHTLRVLSNDPDTPLQEIELRVEGLDVWEGHDIGAVEVRGSDFLQNGVWTIEASGGGISGISDEFHYVFQPLAGNGEIIARVTHVENTHELAQAGIMIRETLAADSAHAVVVITPGMEASFQRRLLAGEDSYETSVAFEGPLELCLVRAGDTFTAYVSADGMEWQEIGTDTIDMPDTVYVGLAVTSGQDGLLCTAVFDEVAVIETSADHFEPNDTFETAVALGGGPQYRADLGIDEPNDEDWLSWTACYDGMVRFEATYDSEWGSLGLELYDSDCQLLAEANYEPGVAFLEWNAAGGDEYYVHIYPEGIQVQASYDLTIVTLGECENYAVLFSGGGSAISNFERYYDNTVELYDVLVNQYDLDEDHIFVLFSDGGAPDLDQNIGTRQNPVYVNSDMSFAANANVAVGTATELQNTLNDLANTLDANDHLFFWAFDHGDGYHMIQGFSGYDQNATTITTEETLTGWGTGQDINDDQLVTWLNQIPAGRITVVLTECFAGGMLDEMRPMADTAFGAAATNHYEFSWGDGFAAAFTEALYNPSTQTMHRNTYDAYKYAHDHDSYAVTRGTYTNNSGTPGNNKEHPWSETTTNFPIFCSASNNLPILVSAHMVRLKDLDATDIVIPYDLLGAACTADDTDGDALSYRIETVDVGELTMNGELVVPGRTLVQYGESIVWHRPDGVAGDVVAFTVRAFDGMTVSDQRMPVVIRLGEPVGALVAADDEMSVDEEVVSVIDVLDNDTGDLPLEVVSVGVAARGTVILEGGIGGSVVYQPAQDFFGEDSFTYFVRDASGAMDWATVHLTVENINDAPQIYWEYDVVVVEDTVDNVIDVVGRDWDPDGDPLTPEIVVWCEHGILEVNPDRTVSYTPDWDYVGPDRFVYVASDGQAQSEESEVLITVVPESVNERPDLVVTDVWIDGPEDSLVYYQVRNIGVGSAAAGHLTTLFVDGILVDEDTVLETLEPDERWSGTFDWPPSFPDDSVSVRVVADQDHRIAELNEENNSLAEIWLGDTLSPIIDPGPAVQEITQNSAHVVWSTNEYADSTVRYGLYAGVYDAMLTSSDLVMSHDIVLDELTPATTYHAVVESTDAAGNTVTSDPFTFRTIPADDIVPPEVSIYVPGTIFDIISIDAVASDNEEVTRVEFYVGDDLVHTDYSPPYTYELDTRQYDNGDHLIESRAYDVAGQSSSAQQPVSVANPIDVTVPVVTITTPQQDDTVSGEVTVRATASDDVGLHVAQFYVDGVYTGFEGFPSYPTSATIEFTWDSNTCEATGPRLGVVVYDVDGKSAMDTVDVVVDNTPPPQPRLVVTSHTATRMQHGFLIELTVKNVGAGDATDLVIHDGLRGFQPTSHQTTIPVLATYEAGHDPSTMYWDTTITCYEDLASGASFTFTYSAIPVMTWPTQVTPSIGTSTGLWYEDTEGTKYSSQVALPVTQTVTNVPIVQAHADALKQANYLITTDPQYLFWQYGTVIPGGQAEVNALLADMAQLAVYEQGALGYFYPTDMITTALRRYALDLMIQPGGLWAKQLHPDFSKPLKGYMLIVGETEIMPSWPKMTIGGGTVEYSDHPYADTGGDGAPDLIVGRIIGDSAADLRTPIQTSMGVYAGTTGYDFDRDNALLVSGPGFGSFIEDVENVADVLDAEFDVTIMHMRDYYVESSFAFNYEFEDWLAAEDVTGGAEAEIIIADEDGDKLLVFDANGATVAEVPEGTWDGWTKDSLAVGDVAGTDKAEIILADSATNTVFVIDLSGTVLSVSSFPFSFDAKDWVIVGDVIADGKAEIVLADRSAGKIYVCNDQGTVLKSFSFSFYPSYTLQHSLAVGDVLGDATEEIVIADWKARMLYTYDADGQQLASAKVFDKKAISNPRLALANLSSEAKLEIVLAPAGDYHHVFAYRWEGTAPSCALKEVQNIPTALETYDSLATGDVKVISGVADRDEIIVADRDGNMIYVVDPDSNHFVTRFQAALPSNTINQDVIFWSGHGNINKWDGAFNSHDEPSPVFPVNFNGHNPVVFGVSCETGNYERSAAEDRNVAERFLQSGAAIYIGATEESWGYTNRNGAKQFYETWDPWEDVGTAFTALERAMWNSSEFTSDWREWIGQYNLYGDPKFGAAAPGAGVAAAAADTPPSPTLDLVVPDYVVAREGDFDIVEIPNGQLWLDDGQVWLPYYTSTVEIPAGYEVQDVALTNRSGLVQATGLNLPANPDIPVLCTCELVPADTGGWFPEQTYTWESHANADGSSTLVVTMFPFYYNSRTTDVKFYQNFSFDIAYTSSTVAIRELATDQSEYIPGQIVMVDLGIENTGTPQDVVVRAVVTPYLSDEIVDGLLLETLDELVGEASFAASWDTTGVAPGYYSIEVTLTDTAQNVLDRATQVVRVGTVSAECTDLQAVLEPDIPTGTPTINVSLSVDNTGSQELIGAMAVVGALDDDGQVIAETVIGVPDLASGESETVVTSFDVSSSSFSASQVVAYITFDACVTQPMVTDIIDNDPPRVSVDELLTNDPSPELTGTVDDPDAAIEVTVDGNSYAAVNNGDGTWTLADDTISPALADGNYDVAVTATDLAGNIGTDSSFDELTVDTTAPVVTVDTLLTNDNAPPLTGTVNDPGAVILVTVAGNTYDAANNGNGTWTLADDTINPALADETYDIGVTATDLAGNVGTDATTDELTVDTTPPVVTVDSLLTSDTTPPLTGTIDDADAVIEVTVAVIDYDAVNNGDGTWTLPDDAISPALAEGNYDIAVTATDLAGNIGTDSSFDELTISLDLSQLLVDSLEVIPSGFIAHFNHQIDPDVLNLYDTEAGIYGPADFTVVGDSVGLVAGSLICSEDGTFVSFIKTGSPLEPDTYTITVRSAVDAFKDTEGHLLDGDADDVEGGDYVMTVTIEPTTVRLMAIPDLARGPGQDVNVPAVDFGIPVTISNGSNVLSLDFVFDYDPALLSVAGVSLASGLPSGWGLVYNLGTLGHVVVTMYGTTPLDAGEIRLVEIEVNVPEDAPYGSAAILSLSNIQINEGAIGSLADCAIQVAAYFGDATGNHTYSGLDAAYIARVGVGLDGGFAAYRLKDPVIVADVTSNGRLSGLDAAYVARKAVGFVQAEIPDLPNPLPGIIASGRDPLLSIPDNLTVQRGSAITVPILVDDASDLFLADIDLQYDTNVFDLSDSGVNLGDLTTGWNLITNVDDAEGRVRLSAYSSTALSGGFGSIVELEFNVRADAALDVIVIDLLESCSLNEGALVLTLQDGEVTIQGDTRIPTLLAWKHNDKADISLARKLADLVDGQITVVLNDSDGNIERRASTIKKDDTLQLISNYNEIGIEETTSVEMGEYHWTRLILKARYVPAVKAKDRKRMKLNLVEYLEQVRLNTAQNLSRLYLVLRSRQPQL